MNRVGLNMIAFFANKSSITVCNKYGNLLNTAQLHRGIIFHQS